MEKLSTELEARTVSALGMIEKLHDTMTKLSQLEDAILAQRSAGSSLRTAVTEYQSFAAEKRRLDRQDDVPPEQMLSGPHSTALHCTAFHCLACLDLTCLDFGG